MNTVSTVSNTRRLSAVRPLLLAAATVSLAGCGLLGGGALAADEVESRISDKLSEMVGETPDDVSCPDDLPAEEGAEMTCVLTAGEDTIDVAVTVTSVEDGTVNFDIQVADEVN